MKEKKEMRSEREYSTTLQRNISFNIGKFKELYSLTYVESAPALKSTPDLTTCASFSRKPRSASRK